MEDDIGPVQRLASGPLRRGVGLGGLGAFVKAGQVHQEHGAGARQVAGKVELLLERIAGGARLG